MACPRISTRRNITGGIQITVIPESEPQPTIGHNDRLGGTYVTPLCNCPGTDKTTAYIRKKRDHVEVIPSP